MQNAYGPVYNGISAITYGSGKFVALSGSYGTFYYGYSTDGLAWSVGTLPAYAQWSEIVSNGTNFIAFATGNQSAISTNGITWTANSLNFNPSDNMFSFYLDGKYIISGTLSNQQTTYRSTDGLSWTQDTQEPLFSKQVSIAYDGVGKYLIVPKNYNIFYSSTDLVSFDGPSVSPSIGNNQDKTYLAYGNGIFVG
jgi:hypothetical protein